MSAEEAHTDMAERASTITWSVRDRNDAPHHDLADVFRSTGSTVEMVEWTGDRRRWSEPTLGRRTSRGEPSRVHLPSPSALWHLANARGVIVTRELNVQTAVAGLLHRKSRLICLIEADPAFGGASPTAAWKRPLRALIARRVECFAANTEGAASWLRSEMAVDAERIVTGWWLAGFDAALVQRESTSAAIGPLRVAAVGKLIGRKGFDLLAEAAATLRADGVPIELRIAGRGPDEARLQAIDPEASLLGHLSRRAIVELFAESDVLVLPSFEELMGRAAVEALSCGLPVVVSSATGVAETLVEPSGAGLVVPSESVDHLANALRSLHEDRQLLATVAQAARALAPTLSPERCAETIRLAIERAAGR